MDDLKNCRNPGCIHLTRHPQQLCAQHRRNSGVEFEHASAVDDYDDGDFDYFDDDDIELNFD